MSKSRKHNREARLKRLQLKIDKIKATAEYMENVDLNAPCIYSTGSKNDSGYSLMWADILGFTSPTSAHVVSWMLHNHLTNKNQIPRDRNSHLHRKEIHHLCSERCTTSQERYLQRSCIQPLHLVPLTHSQNLARSSVQLATHCKRGHDLSKTRGTAGSCKTCDNDRNKFRYATDMAYRIRRLDYQRKTPTGKLESARPKTEITCGHPDRKHGGYHMCSLCYNQWRYQQSKIKKGSLGLSPSACDTANLKEN